MQVYRFFILIKIFFLLLLFLVIPQNIQSSELQEDIFFSALKKEYVQQNPIDKQIEIYNKLYDQPENNITSRSDLYSKRIRGYIDIAQEGIRYIEYHYQTNITVIDSCKALHRELLEKKAEGLTPVEFILFNMKLALIQEIYPDDYPLELGQETKALLNDGRWKTTRFYDFEPLTDASFSWNQAPRSDLISRFLSAFRDSDSGFALKPYIIYNPYGGFKASRMIKHLLGPDGKHRNLCALPIGKGLMKNSPHGVYNCDPFEFLEHDLIHALVCWENLSMPGVQHFLTLLGSIVKDNIGDPVIETFLFLIVHEFIYRSNGFTREFLSVDDSSRTLIDYFSAFYRNVQHSLGANPDPRVEANPFTYSILYGFCQDHLDCRMNEGDVTQDVPNQWSGSQKISMGDKESTFTYKVRRTGELSPRNHYYEYLEVVEISTVSAVDDSPVDQLLTLNGQKLLILTKEALASNEYGVINTILKGLGRKVDISQIDPLEIISGAVTHNLELELLSAFRKKIATLLPGTAIGAF
jgi:hypothetical protein